MSTMTGRDSFDLLRLMVETTLRNPYDLEWSAQGLGMLRVYLQPNVRLHVWDRELLVPGASPLHTHPWDFRSTVIAGRLENRRYACGVAKEDAEVWNQVMIQCGESAHVVNEKQQVELVQLAPEFYQQGDTYEQQATEVHWSLPEDGTVTICERVFKEDRDHAFVFWRGKGGWVDAKPRPATRKEVGRVTLRALETWF